MIGEGLQAFCVPGSVAEDRKVGKGHGDLGAMLLGDDTECFAFLAGHESFAAAEGAIGIALNANKARKKPLRVILNGLGKDAAQIIARINGFTYVKTQFDYFTGELNIVEKIPYSDGPRAEVNCYGADDVREGVAIMWHENVDISITGNSTNPTRFQHPVAGTYFKERVLAGKKYFSVASGGGTGRTLHPDNMAAGPASYGMTDTMGRMHSSAQFAGSSSVPAHVDMMGLIGNGQQPHGRCDRRLRRCRQRRSERVVLLASVLAAGRHLWVAARFAYVVAPRTDRLSHSACRSALSAPAGRKKRQSAEKDGSLRHARTLRRFRRAVGATPGRLW